MPQSQALTQVHSEAIHYLLAHQAEHLAHDRHHLVERCAKHLQDTLDLLSEHAHIVALQALGELDARGNSARIDVNHGTSFVVFVVDPATKAQIAFTAADLIRIAREKGHATVAGAVRH